MALNLVKAGHDLVVHDLRRESGEPLIAAIEGGLDEFFIQMPDRKVKLVVMTYSGQKYLKTEGKGQQADGLLALPTS